jgi:hypothetical protein
MIELNQEEASSLRDRTQVEGSVIRKFLEHYHSDNNDIKVHPEFAGNDALQSCLNDVYNPGEKNKKHLLIMHVNAFNGSFEEPSHYVGLIVDRQNNRIQYIDPMGHEGRDIHETLRSSINQKVGSAANIETYRGRIQYAEVEKVSGIQTFKEGHNDHDCGPMLIYLMSKADRDIELPPLIGQDVVELSKDIGNNLRKCLLDDSEQQSKNIFSFDVEAMKSARPQSEIPIQVSENLTKKILIKQAIRQPNIMTKKRSFIKSTNLKQNMETKIEVSRESTKPGIMQRRLDSIARLIPGKSVCSAVAFDGEKILFSHNDNRNSGLAVEMFRLFKDIIDSGLNNQDISNNTELSARINELKEKAIKEHSGLISNKGEKAKYAIRVNRDMRRIIKSLTKDYSGKFDKIPEVFIVALQEEKYEYIEGRIVTTWNKGLKKNFDLVTHAEITLLDRLVQQDHNDAPTLDVRDEEIRNGNKSLPIGITMLCCRDCYKTVAALNEEYQGNKQNNTKAGAISDFCQLIGVRGHQLHEYPWAEPQFFEQLPKVRARYNELGNNKIRYIPGVPLFADTSSSESDKESVVSNGDKKTTIEKVGVIVVPFKEIKKVPEPQLESGRKSSASPIMSYKAALSSDINSSAIVFHLELDYII